MTAAVRRDGMPVWPLNMEASDANEALQFEMKMTKLRDGLKTVSPGALQKVSGAKRQELEEKKVTLEKERVDLIAGAQQLVMKVNTKIIRGGSSSAGQSDDAPATQGQLKQLVTMIQAQQLALGNGGVGDSLVSKMETITTEVQKVKEEMIEIGKMETRMNETFTDKAVDKLFEESREEILEKAAKEAEFDEDELLQQAVQDRDFEDEELINFKLENSPLDENDVLTTAVNNLMDDEEGAIKTMVTATKREDFLDKLDSDDEDALLQLAIRIKRARKQR